MLKMIESQCSEKSLAAPLCGELSSMTQIITDFVCYCVDGRSRRRLSTKKAHEKKKTEKTGKVDNDDG